MASNSPFGLRPFKEGNGSPWCGEVNLYHIPSTDATAYYIGHPVTLNGTGDATGIPSVSVGVAGAAILGAIVFIYPVKPIAPSLVGTTLSLEDTFIPATKTRDYYVGVVDDPDVEYLIQSDASTFAVTNIGLNANFTVAAPSNNQQFSATVINTSSAATTATLNLKLRGILQREDNEVGAFNDWIVRINNHLFRAGVVGV